MTNSSGNNSTAGEDIEEKKADTGQKIMSIRTITTIGVIADVTLFLALREYYLQ